MFSWLEDAEGTVTEGTDCKLEQIDRKSGAVESDSHTICPRKERRILRWTLCARVWNDDEK